MHTPFPTIAPSPWRVYGHTLASRFLIGSAGYPSPAVLERATTALVPGDAVLLFAAIVGG